MALARLLTPLQKWGLRAPSIDSSAEIIAFDADEHDPVLQLIEEDDEWIQNLRIGSNSSCTESGQIEMELPRNCSVLARLGEAIGRNEMIRTLCFDSLRDLSTIDAEALQALIDGIKRNKSIKKPVLWGCDRDISDGAGYELLEAFRENALNFSRFEIWRCGLGGEAVPVVASFLEKCANLEKIRFTSCRMGHSELRGLVSSILKCNQLYDLNLDFNTLGGLGCEAIATMLKDPRCNLRIIRLRNNNIDDEGAIVLANALSTNDKLEELHLDGNGGITRAGWSAFSQLLCDETSTNATHMSNHTLNNLGDIISLNYREFPRLVSSLQLNESHDKSSVRTTKIMQSRANLDVKPLFQWDLKLLPFVVNWIDNAASRTENKEASDVASMKLSVIYQFIQSHPPQVGCVDAKSYHCLGNEDSKVMHQIMVQAMPAMAIFMLFGAAKTSGLV